MALAIALPRPLFLVFHTFLAMNRPRSAPPHSPRRSLPAEVRIIGGQWRRRRLPVLHKEGLRPTPDRVRETLFNWLGQDLTGWHCLDAFAGTGALGFEAASRHATQVTMNERDPQVFAQLEQSVRQLGAAHVLLHRGDGLQVLVQPPSRQAKGWDLILLDPPFASDLDAQALPLAWQALADDGFVYLESARAWTDAAGLTEQGWRLHRYLKAGAVHAHLLQKG